MIKERKEETWPEGRGEEKREEIAGREERRHSIRTLHQRIMLEYAA